MVTSKTQAITNQFNEVDMHYTISIDYNGDCAADLALLSLAKDGSSVIEFYTKTSNGQFAKENSYVANGKIVFMTLADLDRSASPDVIFVEDNKGKLTMKVLLNNALQIEICRPVVGTPFNFQPQILTLPVTLATNSQYKIGDVNADGYPDLLVVYPSPGKPNGPFKAGLFVNSRQHDKYSFTVSPLYANPLESFQDCVAVSFWDFSEAGRLGFLVFNRQGGKIYRNSIINNIHSDTMMIKILPLAPSATSGIGSVRIPAAMGVAIQWSITNLDGGYSIQAVWQRSQWNHGIMQLPFCIAGLGRTNNYVQQLTVGYPLPGLRNSWSPIIPNSQLMVFQSMDSQADVKLLPESTDPFKPIAPLDIATWRLEMLLTDTTRKSVVVYMAVGFLACLGVLIIVLHKRERMEDLKDHYNFIQLIR